MSFKPQLLPEGSLAPDVSGKDQDGNPIALRDFRGRKVILFFYPQDDTPTCTKEACNLRDNYELLRKKGYILLGVSQDDARSHQKFRQKYQLPFPLIADTDRQWLKAFGVWGEKQMFGRTYMGTHRVTYVIDEEGRIQRAVYPVKSAQHTEQLLKLLEERG